MSEGFVVIGIVFAAGVLSIKAMLSEPKSQSEDFISPEPITPKLTETDTPKKRKRTPSKPKAEIATKAASKVTEIKQEIIVATPTAPDTKPVKKTAKPATKKPLVSAPLPAADENTGKISFKNPLTGETTGHYTNYRFSKRWLKEALVKEGLLERVYKTNELNEAIEANIKSAVDQLATMKKYQG